MGLTAEVTALSVAGAQVVFLLAPEVGGSALIHDRSAVRAQNIMPENIPISPIFVGRRRVCLAALAASAIASVQIGSWVFSKIIHSLSGLWMTFLLL